jgi:high affinity Mn2+ porin
MRSVFCLLFATLLTQSVVAQDSLQRGDRFNLHFQTTYIYQYKPSFHSPYEALHSLTGKEEKQNSMTATLFAGARLWKGAEVYINPEVAGGSGLSGASGMGGSSNGETFRVGDPAPTLYLGRAYITQYIPIGPAGWEQQDDDANQVRVKTPVNYIKIMAGKYSLADVFDFNNYSNSTRTQFMNWSIMNNGAWDFAANVRGYTYILSAIVNWKQTTFKIAAASLPKTANGNDLQTRIDSSLSLNAELSHLFKVRGRDLNLRLLAFNNKAPMGNYKDAITHPVAGTPDIVAVEQYGRNKYGFGLNMDYAASDVLGLFARLGWNDGKTETWCFTEIDQTLSVGASLNGKVWKRPDDAAGIALVGNGLSKDHRNYLAAGGYGFVLGDGALNYAPEGVAEVYYSWKPSAKAPLFLSGDYQFVVNPGYNSDRGPVHIFSLRVHAEL